MPLVLACVLYLNGLGFRRIGAILSEGMPSPKVQRTPLEDALVMAKVNHNSVIRSEGMPLAWVKEYGKEIEKIFPIDKTKRHCKVIEIDEMWHYVEKKTKIVDLDCFCHRHPFGGNRETKEVLAWQTGSRGKKTLKKLLIQISHISCDYYASDKWKVYRQLIPENKLIQSSEGMPLAWEKQKPILLNLKIAGFVIIWLASAMPRASSKGVLWTFGEGIPSEKEKRFAIQNP